MASHSASHAAEAPADDEVEAEDEETGLGGKDDEQDEEAALRAAMKTAVCLKRPAAAVFARPAAKDALFSRPAAKEPKVRAPAAPVGSSKCVPKPFEYRGAAMATSWTMACYRVTLNPTASRTDKRFDWKAHGGHELAWQAAIAYVDASRV